MTFSIDSQGPTAGLTPLTEGDILAAGPGVVIGAGALGIAPAGPGGFRELDALSYGSDFQFQSPLANWLFSVDEFAVGNPLSPAFFPSVTTEGATGNLEASADVFFSSGFTPPIPGSFGFNVAVTDGNGVAPFGGPGIGLIEPNPPTPGGLVVPSLPDPGDNLDALDVDTPINSAAPVYFSLDSAFVDPLEAAIAPPNTGTAVGQPGAFVGGDVLVVTPGAAAPTVYASAVALGLDALGPDQDDIDALVLFDNGAVGPDGVYTPGTDFLAFSVRRGSAIIGTPDAFGSGLAIEEGDILVPVAGTTPGILAPAEALGLATVRSGVIPGLLFGDDLDALDRAIDVNVPEPASLALLITGCLLTVTRYRPRLRRRVCHVSTTTS